MPFPSSITPITVTATYLQADGSPCSGTVTFTPSITTEIAGYIIPVRTVVCKLDHNGLLEVDLMATDDPDWEVPGFYYEVTEIIKDAGKRRTYNIQIPYNSSGGVLDLASVAPIEIVDPVIGASYFRTTGGTVSGDIDVLGDLKLGGSKITIDQLNVKAFGAKGDGTTDDTSAIQNAINTAFAGVGQHTVFLPPGVYRITAPLTLHPGVTLKGSHGSHLEATSVYNTSSIKPTSAMAADTGAIKLIGQAQSGGLYSTLSSEQRILNLTIDGSSATGTTLNGIEFTGAVHGVYIDNVAIRKMPARGIATNVVLNLGPYSCRMTRVVADQCGNIGFSLNNVTDSFFLDLQAMNCTASGFFISGCGNSSFVGCRSEFNGLHGYDLRGGTGLVQLLGCSTDRNERHGISIDSNSVNPGTINIIGARLNRDGKNAGAGGGSFAALNINGAVTAVHVSGLVTNVGKEDNGSGTDSPQYGVAVTGSTHVVINSGLVHGATAGYFDGGGNTLLYRGLGVTERSGSGTAPTYTTGTRHLSADGRSLGMPTPQDYGFTAWTYDPNAVSSQQTATNNTIFLAAVYVPRTTTITKIHWGVGTAGATPTAGQNHVGIYNAAGTRLASTNVDADISSTGVKATTIASTTLTPGLYWVAWVFNASTAPSLYRAGFVSALIANVNLSTANYRFATNGTGTALPSTITPGANVASQNSFWAAIAP